MGPELLADIEEIRRLTCDYGFYWDTRDLDGYVGCFVPDGVMDPRPSDPNIPAAVGREAIRVLADSIISQQLGQDGGGGSVHAQWNHRIDVSGDMATGTVYFMALGALIGGGRTEWLGYYNDEYRRTDDGWKFVKRELFPLMPIRSEGLEYERSAGAGGPKA
jgi:ketosteroid isomerase-like protein